MTVPIRDLNDEQLARLSRDGHLFLSMTEMKAVQDFFRQKEREPTDAELETIAQTWSEHCVHKTLKSAVEITEQGASGQATKTRQYENLIKQTIFESTQQLMKKRAKDDPFCLSVFKDNAGVVVFDDEDAVCFKVETHNHPSAIEPYGGSATGIGGCIRDIMGTGLSAKPVGSTDIFCVAFPDSKIHKLPKGVIHPKRVLRQIVAGVRDYGNRMGIPTINGGLYFDDRYLGNPLVFCGCVGLIPRDKIDKAARVGDAIVVMGGRTGRDGIHGATFSSAELTDTHADEFSHAVQIGNAITQKKMTDVILNARDKNLFSGITDCGAGGLSSAIGEMGEKVGAFVELGKVPLKYAGLRYDEIWISEAQERMVLSVPQANVSQLLSICASEDVEATVIGTFGTEKQDLVLDYNGHEVARIAMSFLHDGIPMPTRSATVRPKPANYSTSHVTIPASESDAKARLLKTLAHPNVASKHWVIRQYDHEVQGGSVVKPLVGPEQIGPSDASVFRPKLGSRKGVVVGCGMAPAIEDPYTMAVASIDEAIRNIVAVGADLRKTAILDNFCWPSVDDDRTMGTLVSACEACHDVALAYGVPFISGKDSLHNQFTNSETGQVLRIPNTLLISAIGIINDVRQAVTMDFKHAGSNVMLIEPRPDASLTDLAHLHHTVAGAVASGLFASVHDVSDGGLVTSVAEMAIASGLGAAIKFDEATNGIDSLFVETLGRYVVEVTPTSFNKTLAYFEAAGASIRPLGNVVAQKHVVVSTSKKILFDISIDDLTSAWRGTLDW